MAIDWLCLGKFGADMTVTFGWKYLYTNLFGHFRFTILVLQDIVLDDLIMSMSTTLAIHITLYGLNITYISCNNVL